MSLTVEMCGCTWDAWAAWRTSVEAGADDNLDVCKMNFCTVMLLQCRVCTSMASVGRRAYFLTVLLVLVQKRRNPGREKMT